MLSATSAGITAPEPPIAQFDTSSSQLNSANGQPGIATTPNDGGYINANSVPTKTFHSSGSQIGVATDTNVVGNFADWGVTRSATDAASSSNQFNGSLSYTTGLQPVVIELSNNNLSGPHSSDTLVINPTDPTRTPDEGGAIPIHTIGAGLRQETSLVSSDSSGPNLSADMKAVRTSARLTDSSQKAITGELARAVIFEFAGGEPGTNDHVSVEDRRAKSQDNHATLGDGPITSVELQRAAMNSSDRQDPASAMRGESELPMPRTATATAVAFYRASRSDLLGNLNNDSPGSDPSLFTANKLIDGSAVAGGQQLDGAARATDAAFDQIGQTNMAIVESPTATSQWTRYRGAAPLLMVLALERLAAINSRHSAKESSVTTSRKSHRLRVFGKADRR